MNFYPLYECLNNYFLTKRCNHERLKHHFARPWGNAGLVIIYMSLCPCKAAAPKGPAFCFLNYPRRFSIKRRFHFGPVGKAIHWRYRTLFIICETLMMKHLCKTAQVRSVFGHRNHVHNSQHGYHWIVAPCSPQSYNNSKQQSKRYKANSTATAPPRAQPPPTEAPQATSGHRR